MSLKIEYLPVDELVPYAKNARKHSGAQIEQVVASIKEFGFTNPVLIDENNILIAGHGRTQAAKIAGLSEIPVIRLSGLSEPQRKALRIADNQIPLNASWDMDLLMEEVQDLNLAEFDLELMGFDENMLETLLYTDDEDPDLDDSAGKSNTGTDVKYLSIGKEKVPISEEEETRLINELKKYITKYGTNFGFATTLIKGV